MENSKEPGKKKIKEADLGTVSGGCGKKTKPKFHVGQRALITLGPLTPHYGHETVGTIIKVIESVSPKGHFDYLTKCDLDGKGDFRYYDLCFEDVPGCMHEREMNRFRLL